MLTSHMPDYGWWIIAGLSGLALGVAGMTLGETRGKRIALLVVPPLGGFVFALGHSLGNGDSWQIAVNLYTLAMLGLAITRFIYTPWIRRQTALRRAGKPVAEVGARHAAAFMFTALAVIVGVAFLIH